jgi:hypothetical protein
VRFGLKRAFLTSEDKVTQILDRGLLDWWLPGFVERLHFRPAVYVNRELSFLWRGYSLSYFNHIRLLDSLLRNTHYGSQIHW